MRQLKSKIFTDVNVIKDFQKDWDSLFERSGCGNVFLHSSWALTFISHNRIKGKPTLITVWDKDMLLAVLPLDLTSKFGIKTAHPIGDSQPSYLGILVDENFKDAIKMVAEVMRKEKITCFINQNLSQLDETTFTLMKEIAKNRFSFLKISRNICHYIKIKGSYEEYLQKTKSSKRRKKLRYEERRLLSSGDFQIRKYSTGEMDEQILIRIAAIQQESWMKRRGAAVIGQDFYQDLLKQMISADLVYVWILTNNDRDVAFVLGLASRGHFNYYRTAFRVAYESKLSVGKILTMHVIHEIFDDDYLMLDFGHGEAEYKRFWGTDTYNVYRSVAAIGIRGLLISLFLCCLWKMIGSKFLKKIFHKIKRVKV